jgi:hypothetical protein
MLETRTIHPNGVYRTDDLCALLDVSPATLAEARRTHALKAARKGRSWVFLGAWVLDWLHQPAEAPAGGHHDAP